MAIQNTWEKLIVKIVSILNMTILNRGSTKTFQISIFGESIPDITFELLIALACAWKVMDDFINIDPCGEGSMAPVFVMDTADSRFAVRIDDAEQIYSVYGGGAYQWCDKVEEPLGTWSRLNSEEGTESCS